MKTMRMIVVVSIISCLLITSGCGTVKGFAQDVAYLSQTVADNIATEEEKNANNNNDYRSVHPNVRVAGYNRNNRNTNY